MGRVFSMSLNSNIATFSSPVLNRQLLATFTALFQVIMNLTYRSTPTLYAAKIPDLANEVVIAGTEVMRLLVVINLTIAIVVVSALKKPSEYAPLSASSPHGIVHLGTVFKITTLKVRSTHDWCKRRMVSRSFRHTLPLE